MHPHTAESGIGVRPIRGVVYPVTLARTIATVGLAVAPRVPPFRITVATPVVLPAIVSGVGIVTASVVAGHRAERRIRRPVPQDIVITPAVLTVQVFTPIAEHKEAARSDAQGVVCVGAAAGHQAATHTRQPAGEDIPIGVAGPGQSVNIAVTKPVTAHTRCA